MKRLVRAVASIVAAGALVVGPAIAAQAVPGECWSGFSCGWDLTNYGNGADPWGTSKSTTRWAEAGKANWASSASANGGSCKATRFYKSWNYTTNAVYGDYFTLQSMQLVGTNWKDADLSNGAGGSSGDWNNTIEGTLYVLC